MFKAEERPVFEPVPPAFESFEQYRDTWIPLFLYETYNQLINQRYDGDKERELLEAQGIKVKRDSQQQKMHFEGYLQ
jgi:hypothetical protein